MELGAELFLGIDLGTSVCKVLLCDATGAVLAAAEGEVKVDYPRPCWAESDPEGWWDLVAGCTREALAISGRSGREVRAVGLAGFMHSPVPIDAEGKVLTPAMLWSDQRCAPQVAELTADADSLLKVAGLRPGTLWTAPKLRWLQVERPEVLARTKVILLPKDYIRFRLTGQAATDYYDAWGTMMFDREGGDWAQGILDWIGISRDKLPPLKRSTEVGGFVTAQAAAATGLAQGTPVAMGAGDAFCTMVGTNAHAPSRVCLYMGTAGWLSAFREPEGMDSFGPLIGFATASCTGSAFYWCRELLRGWEDRPPQELYQRLLREAAEAEPGAGGLVFIPHLMGERGFPANPQSKGVFFGLTLAHGRKEVARAVLEGTAFALRRSFEGGGFPLDAQEVVACGGGARSPLWRRIFAHVFKRPVGTPVVLDTGGLAAAMMGAVAVGAEPSLHEAAERWVRFEKSEPLDADLVDRYERIYRVYADLDEAMTPFYSRLPAC